MTARWWPAIVLAGAIFAQQTPPPAAEPSPDAAADQEQLDLSRALAEAGSSSVDFTRALERHLGKYPQSAQRDAIEKALAKSASEANDRTRILLYGERVLAAEPASTDLLLLDRVTRALLDTDDPANARKALAYANRYAKAVDSLHNDPAKSHLSEAQWTEEVNRGRARASLLQARATGNAGNPAEALRIARSAWDANPGAEPAREIAKWLSQLNRDSEALEYLADAFTMEDARATEADRARDRVRMGEIYSRLHGSEKGMGDLILTAYDRMAALRRDRLASLHLRDPNAGADEIGQFTLQPVSAGSSLPLASLKGKIVIMDFWATWCAPCRVQHPLLEEVKQKYASDGSIVFLSLNTDDDRTLVPAFIKNLHWQGANYFESGLAHLLTVDSIPTLLVLNREGKVASRMAGFIPERFKDMLVERIEEIRSN